MEKRSCKNCGCLELDKKEVLDGRLIGRYRYGCSNQRGGYICGFLADDEKLESLVCHLWRSNSKSLRTEDVSMDGLGKQLQTLFDRWNEWFHHGSPSVVETDGICLNRLRLAIINQMDQMEMVSDGRNFPDCYYSQVPSAVSEEYMADPDGIMAAAMKALNKYRDNLDYIWLKGGSPEGKAAEAIKRFMDHEAQLEGAITGLNHLNMKRLSNQDTILSDLAAYRRKTFQKKEKGASRKRRSIQGQLTLFEERAS